MTAGGPSKRHTLYLLRHAKSDWGGVGTADHARPLAPRGQRAARDMAAHLRRGHIHPEVVLCSTALRARQTLSALGLDREASYEDGLYAATAEELLDRLRMLAEATSSALVVGHNPGMQELAGHLAGKGSLALRERLSEKLPTGALAELAFRVPWADLGAGVGELKALVVPREL